MAIEGSGIIDSLLNNKDMNPRAIAVTLSFLDISQLQSYGLFDKWKDVTCGDNSKALVLKNPNDAFELYATEWSTKFNVVVDLINQVKSQASAEISNKIVKLFDNLNYVEATLREMYKNAYLTFAATPCKEEAQAEKRKMDRIIVVASLSLIGFKTILESKMTMREIKMMSETNASDEIDHLSNEILKIIDKVTSMIIG